MFDRFKNRSTTDDGATATTVDGNGNRASTTATRTMPADEPRTAAHPRGVATRDTMHRVRARQREEYGGINWGAAFFGWLVAVGVARPADRHPRRRRRGHRPHRDDLERDRQRVGQRRCRRSAARIALLVVLAIAYYCGGYVAGRMSRFDGARQGIGAWAVGLLITLAVAILAVVAGSQYNVVERANLPRLPIGVGDADHRRRDREPADRARDPAVRGPRRHRRRALPPQGRPRGLPRVSSVC